MTGTVDFLIETSKGSYTALNHGPYLSTHIPFQVQVQEIWNMLAPKAIVLRLPYKSSLNAKQFGFLMHCFYDAEMSAEEENVISWKSWRYRMGVNTYICRAKEVGYVLGMRVGNVLLWDDGTFTQIIPNAA